MKKHAHSGFREPAIIGFLLFSALALSASAHARPKGVAVRHGDHDHDHGFEHHHRYFDFPYWWYDRYGYDYAYNDSGPIYASRYWQDLAIKVQSELARLGYYHGEINGVIDSSSRQAIRDFQKANGLPETGLVDGRVLRSLGVRS